MRLLRTLARSLAVLLALGGAAFADTTMSQSNDPTTSVDTRLSRLFGQEKESFSEVAANRLIQITLPPSRIGKTGPVPEVQYDAAWVDALPVASGDAQWDCLAKAVYFEARGESIKGEFAVAEVIVNRVDSPDYPDTICGVVNQGAGQHGGCQFSFVCDGNPETIAEADSFVRAGKIARLILDGAPRTLTNGATHFHTTSVRPAWAHSYARTAAIGAHLFYRDPIYVALN